MLLLHCARLARDGSALDAGAHLASGYSREQITSLEGLLLWPLELLVVLERNEPERGLRLVVVTVTLATVTLDERRGPEVLQTGARSRQGLATATVANGSVH